ncbi:uncharacterized protein ARMOST_04499 [Armillaria ostoyae]|uniref:Uncharacterized protein n=1 Tax=Armillaria ostoyae TaxID=47428 RepID=A0A284QXH8_ARMOS|nr:uncharacterized protein ARMOST_04499 [Armillaria ostoyae]
MASPLTLASRQARIQFTDDATCDGPFTSGLKRTFGDNMLDMELSVITWESLLKKRRVNTDHSITKGNDAQDSAIVPSNNGATVSPVPDLNFTPFSSEEWRKQFSRMALQDMLTNIEHRDSWPRIDGLIPSMRRSPVPIKQSSLAFHYFSNGVWPAKIHDIIPSIWNRVPFCHFHELLEWSATCMPPGFLHKGIGEGYVRAGSWNSEMKSHAYLVIHQDNKAYLRTLALTCPELTDIWDVLTLVLIYEIPFHIGFLLRDYHAFSYPQASLSLDDRTLVKAFLEPSYTNPPLIYRRSGIALIAEYHARI